VVQKYLPCTVLLVVDDINLSEITAITITVTRDLTCATTTCYTAVQLSRRSIILSSITTKRAFSPAAAGAVSNPSYISTGVTHALAAVAVVTTTAVRFITRTAVAATTGAVPLSLKITDIFTHGSIDPIAVTAVVATTVICRTEGAAAITA
jgi:hypothetical protein